DARDLPVHQQQQNFFADEMLVAFVFRVYGNGGITQHGLRSGSSHHNGFAVADGIADLVQLSGNFFVHHFEIGDGRHATGTPVHDVVAAVNQSIFVQPDEGLAHRTRQVFVHREVLALPVD